MEDTGTNVPHPTSYRKLLRDVMQTSNTAGLSDDTRDVVLDAILKGTARDRLVLSNAGFFGTPKMAIGAGVLYKAAENRLSAMHQIFQGDQIELFLAVCNPATFLPALFQNTPIDSFDEFMRGADPRVVRWSEMSARVRGAYPDMPITLWCNEDLPLIWAELIREIAGFDPTASFEGEYTMLKVDFVPISGQFSYGSISIDYACQPVIEHTMNKIMGCGTWIIRLFWCGSTRSTTFH